MHAPTRNTKDYLAEYAYKAFVSYSHHDKKIGALFHQKLERFKIPSDLVGQVTQNGVVPTRLAPVFRDTSDAEASGDLDDLIKEKLSASAYLIVLCGIRSARSAWVGREISYFRELGKRDRIIPVLIDGEPEIHDQSDDSSKGAFHPELVPTEDHPIPLAPDLREAEDGLKATILKVVAAITALRVDELSQRVAELDRRSRRWRIAATSAFAFLIICMLGLGWLATDLGDTVTDQDRLALANDLSKQAVEMSSEPSRVHGFMDLGLLLAIEAVNLSPNVNTRSALLQTLQRSPSLSLFGRAVLTGYEGKPKSIAFRSGSTAIVALGSSQELWHWDLHNGNQSAKKLHPQVSWGSQIAISPVSDLAASLDIDGSVHFLDINTGRRQGTPLILPEKERIRSLVFSHDGKSLTTISAPDSDSHARIVRRWSVSSREQLGNSFHTLASEYLYSLRLNAGSNKIATLGQDRSSILHYSNPVIRLWDLETGKQINQTIESELTNVKYIELSPNGEIIAYADKGKNLRLISSRDGHLLVDPLVGNEADIFSIVFSPNGEMVATAGQDHTIHVWDVASGDPIGPALLGHVGPVTGLKFAPDNRSLASIDTVEDSIRLWSIRRGQPFTRYLKTKLNWASDVEFSPDGRLLFGSNGSDNGIGQLWYGQSGRPVGESLRLHEEKKVRAVAFSPDGNLIASGNEDGSIRFFDPRSGEQFGSPLVGHVGSVFDLAFNDDGKILVSAGQDSELRLWDVELRRQIGSPLRGHNSGWVNGVAISPDGTMIASAGGDETVRLWDISSHKQLHHPLLGHSDGVEKVAFSLDGRIVVSAGLDRTIRFWNVKSGDEAYPPIRGHQHGAIFDVAFSSDGSILASAGEDETVRLWDMMTRQQIGDPLDGHTRGAYRLAFSPAENLLVTTAFDPILRMWDLDLEAQACRTAGRNLTCSEWKHYLVDRPYRATCPSFPDHSRECK